MTRILKMLEQNHYFASRSPTVAAAAAIAADTLGTISAGNAQAAAARQQADILNQQAAYRRQKAIFDEANLRRRQSAQLSSQRALFAAQGLDPTAGSALLLQEDFAGQAELDALTVRAGGLADNLDLSSRANAQSTRASTARDQTYFGVSTKLLRAEPAIRRLFR